MELPETNIKFVVVPNYQNFIRILWRGQSPKPRRTSHNSHTPLDFLNHRATTYSGHVLFQYGLHSKLDPPAKASHHVPHLKLCRNIFSRTITEPKPPSAHHTPLGGYHTPPRATRLQNHHCTITAWRTPPCRQAPLVATSWRIRLAPPGASLLSAPLLFQSAWQYPPYR